MLIYVGNILITSNDLTSILTPKQFLHNRFWIKDLGGLNFFLGIKVFRLNKSISILQWKYILKILKDGGFLGAKPVNFSME